MIGSAVLGKAAMKSLNQATAALGLHSTRSRRALNKKRGRQSTPGFGGGHGGALHLSPCAARFASAIANPFAPSSAGACIPDGNARPSRKGTSFARGTFHSGANGFGSLLISPTVVSSAPFAYASVPANTAITSTNYSPYTVVNVVDLAKYTPVYMSNLPYVQNDVWDVNMLTGSQGTFESVRLVSVGVKVTYAGSIFNQGGTYRCWSDANHESLVDETYTKLGDKLEVDIRRVTAESVTLRLGPVTAEECLYSQLDRARAWGANLTNSVGFVTAIDYPWSQEVIYNVTLDTSPAGSPVAVVAVNSAVPAQPYEYEIVCHWESIGPKSEPSSSPNNADPVGQQTVLAATAKLPGLKMVRPHATPGQLMWDALEDSAAEMVPMAASAVKAMLTMGRVAM